MGHEVMLRRMLGLACASVVESLERRQLFASSLISGPATVDAGTAYTLSLNTPSQGSGTQWTIDWGDGAPQQTVAAGQSTVTHTFTGGTAARTITAGLTNGLPNPIDTSFGTGGKSVILDDIEDKQDKAYDIAVQSDGKLLVAGGPDLNVMRFNTDGTLDPSFGTNGRARIPGVGRAFGLVVQSDGKILVGGGENFAMARFNVDGTPDATFGTNGVASSGFGKTYLGYDLAVVAGGKIVQVGTNDGNNFIISQFNANGSVDTGFGTAGKTSTDFFGSLDKAFGLAVQADGKLVVVGQAREGTTNFKWALARYNANGTLDTSFGTGGKGTTEFGHNDDAAFDVHVQADGRIIVSGQGGSSSTGYDFAIARYDSNGALDTSFGTGGQTKLDFGYGGDRAYALQVLPSGKYLLAGYAQGSSSQAMNFGLARLNANGFLDTTFGNAGKVTTDFAGSTDEAEASVLLPDGSLVVAGGRSTVGANGAMDYALAKYHLDATGTLPVTVVGNAGVDLVVDGLPDTDEESVGGYAALNENHDELNVDARGNPLLDNEPDALVGDRIVASDGDLRDAMLTIPASFTGKWRLVFSPKVRVYRLNGSGGYIPVTSGVDSTTVSGSQVIGLKIEGVEASADLKDVLIQAFFTPSGGSLPTEAADAVRMTVVGVDVDIDSDNDDAYGIPDQSRAEDLAEDDPTHGGKVLYTQDPQRVPVVVLPQLPRPQLAGAKFRITVPDGSDGTPGYIRAWRSAGGTGVAEQLQSGEYTGAQLGLGASVGAITLYLEGLTVISPKTIKVEIDPDGSGPSGYMLVDSVLASVVDGSTRPAMIQGFKWHDLNGDGIRNQEYIQGDPPNLVYTIDVSGSTNGHFLGQEDVGDVNQDDPGDGSRSNTILDSELAGFIALTNKLIADGYAGRSSISIVVFGARATMLDMDLTTPGTQRTLLLSSAINSLLSRITVGYAGVGESTNYVAALDSSAQVIAQSGLPTNAMTVVYLSDGYPNPDNRADYSRKADAVHDSGVVIRAFGAGSGARQDPLDIVDSNHTSQIFRTRDELVAAFETGLYRYTEPALQGWTIYADLNNNGQLDVGTDEQKYSDVTDENGNYAIIGLPAGTYTLREVMQPGWAQTAPSTGSVIAPVTAGQVLGGVNFGNRTNASVDLDVDSDNTNGTDTPDRSTAEDSVEQDISADAKAVNVNADDTDGDGQVDYADFNGIAGEQFVPVVLDLTAIPDLAHATVAFSYSASDPSAATLPADGTLRLWLKNGNAVRSASDFIVSGRSYTPAELGITASTRVVTLWLEAVRRAPSDSDRLIRVDVVPDTTAAGTVTVSDGVYVRPLSNNLPPDFQTLPDPSFNLYKVLPATVTDLPLPAADPSKASLNGQVYFDANNNGMRDDASTNDATALLQPHSTTPVIPQDDDNFSSSLSMGFTFEFFGTNYDTLYVNNNGNITFEGPVGDFTSTGFPQDVNGGRPMIAPFWADVDTRSDGGHVYFTKGYDTTGHKFIQVDWIDVGYFVEHGDKRNDFSLVIQDDPTGDNVKFYYRNMEWTTGDYSGGYEGFGGSPAQIGFDAGDGTNFISEGRPGSPQQIAEFADRVIAYKISPDGIPEKQFTETGADGVVMELLDASGNVVASQTTHSKDIDGNGVIDPLTEQGLYAFDNLASGNYTVRERPDRLWAQTAPIAPSGGPGRYDLSVGTGEHVDTLVFGANRRFTYTPVATDPDNDAVSYSLVESPEGTEWDAATHTLSWLPTAPGTGHFVVRASDGHGHEVDQTFDVEVYRQDPNVNPSITSRPKTTATRTRPFTYTVRAIDPNPSSELIYSVTGPSGLSFDEASKTITWTPTTLDTGEFEVRVTDGRGGIAIQRFSVSVNEIAPNEPPVIEPIPVQRAHIGDQFILDVTASDPELNPIAYSLVGDYPAGMQIQGLYGQIFGWTPTADDRGTRQITVKVTDSHGASSIVTFDVRVVLAVPATPQGLSGDTDLNNQVVLDWDDNTDAGIVGYNIYWYDEAHDALLGPINGKTPVTQSTFTHMSPTPGGDNYYAVTAVNADNEESDPAFTDDGVNVPANGPVIIQASVTPSSTDAKTGTLGVTAVDGMVLETALTYLWTLESYTPPGATQPANGLPDIVFGSANGGNGAKSLPVTFTAAGTYVFKVVVTDPDGLTAESNPLTGSVQSVVTKVFITRPSVVRSPGQTQQFVAVAADQFNYQYELATGEAFEWRMVSSPSGGSIDSDGLYTAGTTGGVQDVIEAKLNGVTTTAQVAIEQTFGTTIIGVGSTNIPVTEGSPETGLDLAGFFDPVTGTTASDYQATIDWGDGSATTTGTVYALTLDGGTTFFGVKGDHTYHTSGQHTFSVTLVYHAWDVPANQRSAMVTGTVQAADAALRGQGYNVFAVRGTAYAGLVATFADDNSFSVASDFSATVDWGDGSAVTGTTIVRNGDVYEIISTQLEAYLSTGDKAIVVHLSQHGSPVMDINSNVTVSRSSVPAPTGFRAEGISSSQIYLEWDENPDAYGYIIWATKQGTNERRRIGNPYLAPTAAPPENPAKYAAWDQGLQPGTAYTYTIQVVYNDGSISSESAAVTGSTWGTVSVPKPTSLTGVQVVASTPGSTAEESGVQLYWDANSTVDGYKVNRRVAGSGGAWVDLLGATNYIDPASADAAGKLSWFDSTTDFDTNIAYEYQVVAYKTDSGSGLVASLPTQITVSKDLTPPSTPTHLEAASYPQAIQLTWDDRDTTAANADWAGWNVYRYDGVSSTWVKLNARLVTEDVGFNDYTIAAGETGIYRVTAVDKSGNESAPATVSHKRSVHGEPMAPGGLFGRPAGTGTIHLDWDVVTPVLDQGWAQDALAGYNIYRKAATATAWPAVPINASTPVSINGFDDIGLSDGTEYEYRVTAVDQDGDESRPSASVVVKSSDGSAPDAPTGLTAVSNESTSIQLTWQRGSSGTIKYLVYRSLNGTTGFVRLGEVADSASGTTTLKDGGLASSTTYYYRVYAVDADGDVSVAAASISKSTQTVPDAAPFVKLTSPGDANAAPLVVSADTKVRGIVDDPNNNLASWTLVLRPLTSTDPMDLTLAEGTAEAGQAADIDTVLASIQPTMLPNGLYRLILKAKDSGNLSSETIGATIQVKTEVKTGNFTLPVEDLRIDVPGGEPIVVRRVYDSSKANVNDDFGYGWSLELSDTGLRTTARAGNRGTESLPAMRQGDIVYINVPGKGEQAFAFIPRPLNYNPNNPGGGFGAYFSYKAQFVAVDGSTSQLTIPGVNDLTLIRDGEEFYVDTSSGRLGFNPARPQMGGKYLLTTPDATNYTINAVSGQIEKSIDANGNVVNYSSGGASGSGQALTVHRTGGRIDWISTDPSGNGPRLNYAYDPVTGNLISVTDRSGKATTYAYQDPTRAHLLTGVVDGRGITVTNVVYDAVGKVTAVKDAAGNVSPVSSGGFDGQTGSNIVTDPNRDTTEVIYDAYGNVIREIKAVRSGNTVVKYVVTVHDFSYTVQTLVDSVQYGISSANKLGSQTDWVPFEISGSDPTGQRYSAQPTKIQRGVTYKIIDPTDPHPEDPDLWLPSSQQVLAPDGTSYLTTEFKNYVLGKPGWIKDPYGNVTENYYNAATGNLEWTKNAFGETTYFTYTSGQDYQYADGTTGRYAGVAKGLLLETYKMEAGRKIFLSRNTYYTTVDGAQGDWGRLKSTTNAAGLTTSYTYTAQGQILRTFREWKADNQLHRVQDSYTTYDGEGRVRRVYDDSGSTPLALDAGDKFTETVYDSSGRVQETIDVFGGHTVNTYDALGQLIRTVNPDGTETRTYYDALGRGAWTTARFKPADASNLANPADTVLLTHTLFNSLGRVVGSEQYYGVAIALMTDTSVGISGILKAQVPTYTPASAQFVASTQTWFDDAGRPLETKGADGLRSGTIYFADGRVRYTGPLTTSAPDGGRSTTTAGKLTIAFDLSDLASYTEYQYDQTDTLGRYDAVIDANGHQTKTYRDALGQEVRTVYDDGSFTQTLYGVNGAIAVAPAGVDLDLPTAAEGWTGVPAGGRHVVKIGQRLPTDTTIVVTHYLYDASGRLTDVWLPAADDASTAAPDLVRAHFHYAYDANGNQTLQRDPKTHETVFVYDDRGRRTQRLLPDGSVESWTYDAFGRVNTHSDFKGQTTAYEYDDTASAGGRLLNEYRFAAGVAALDATGAIRTTAAAEKTNTLYDNLGRTGGVNEYTDGNLTTASRQTVYEYDPVTGGVTLVDSPEGQLRHEYEHATGRLKRTWTTRLNTATNAIVVDTDTRYDYDALGRLWHVRAVTIAGSTPSTPRVTTYGYDAVGNLKLTTEDNGTTDVGDDLVHDYVTYDNLNRLKVLEVRQGDGDKLFTQTFGFLGNGQKSDVTETRYQSSGGGAVFSTATIGWQYDDQGRLKKETYDLDLASVAGNETTQDYVSVYGFDLAGNRVMKTDDKAGTAGDVTTRTTFDERDEGRVTTSGLDLNHDGTIDTGVAVTTTDTWYDANGSTIAETTGVVTKRYVWDLRNRLTGLDANGDNDLSDAGDATFRYDANGVRVGKTVEGGASADTVTSYLQDTANPTGDSQVLEERSVVGTTATLRGYELGLDVIAQADGTPTVPTIGRLLYDGGGSTRAIVDAMGQVATNQVYAYDAFGVRIEDPANPVVPATNLLYRGELWDATLAQYVLRARNYTPLTGRMFSQDPTIFGAGELLDANLYRYGSGNPVRFADPRGLFSVTEMMTQTGIRSFIEQGVGTITKAINIYNRVQQVIELLDYARLILQVAQAVSAPTPAIAFQQISNVLRDKFGFGGGFESALGSGLTDAVQHVAADWPRIATAIGERASEMAGKALTRVTEQGRFAHWLRGEAQGKAKFVFYLPSAPLGEGSNLNYVSVGKEMDIAYSSGGGRLFGFGVRWGDRNDQVDQVLRIDYWYNQYMRPPVGALGIHYHLYGDDFKNIKTNHEGGRDIWP